MSELGFRSSGQESGRRGGGSNGLGRRTLRLHGSRTTSSQVCNARWNPRCLAMSTRGRDVGTFPTHLPAVEILWEIHSMVVVTSPMGLQAPAGAQGSDGKRQWLHPGKPFGSKGDLARNATPPAFAATTTRPPQECLQSFAHKTIP